MPPGDLVWSVIGGAAVVWIVVTTCSGGRLPNLADVGRWWCSCWLGRLLLLAAWGGAGWHLFCQRP